MGPGRGAGDIVKQSSDGRPVPFGQSLWRRRHRKTKRRRTGCILRGVPLAPETSGNKAQADGWGTLASPCGVPCQSAGGLRSLVVGAASPLARGRPKTRIHKKAEWPLAACSKGCTQDWLAKVDEYILLYTDLPILPRRLAHVAGRRGVEGRQQPLCGSSPCALGFYGGRGWGAQAGLCRGRHAEVRFPR